MNSRKKRKVRKIRIHHEGHEEHEVRKKKFFSSNLCALAPLREIFRNLVAALPRWAFVVKNEELVNHANQTL
jgi:hypothetical protein